MNPVTRKKRSSRSARDRERKREGELTDQISERDSNISDDSLDLVELGQMGSVGSLVPEDSINTEHLGGLESSGLVREVVEHLSRNGGGVGSEEETLRFGEGEGSSVSYRSMSSRLVDGRYSVVVVLRRRSGG